MDANPRKRVTPFHHYLKPIRATLSFFRPRIIIGYNTDMRAGDNMGLVGSLINLKIGFARLQTCGIKESKRDVNAII